MARNLSRLLIVLLTVLPPALSQTMQDAVSNYNALIQQGKAQLQAGSNDAALASANAAVKLDTARWEAYAVAGGALINLKRCDEAKRNCMRCRPVRNAPAGASNADIARTAGGFDVIRRLSGSDSMTRSDTSRTRTERPIYDRLPTAQITQRLGRRIQIRTPYSQRT